MCFHLNFLERSGIFMQILVAKSIDPVAKLVEKFESMMIKTKITMAVLKQYSGQSGMIIADTETPGLQARISVRGISFYLYKKINQLPVKKAIGKYPEISIEDARRVVAKLVAEAMNHKMQNVKKQISPTIQDCIDLYIKSVKNTANAASTMKHWSAYARKRVVEFTRSDVIFVKKSLADHPHTANNAMKYLSSAINKMSLEIGEELPNPFRLVPLYRVEPRKRFLKEKECPEFIDELFRMTAKSLYSVQAYAILLMLFTGARTSNVLSMNLKEIDDGVWTIPASKFKGGRREFRIRFNSFAREIVEKRIPCAVRGYLFVRSGKTDHIKSIRKTFRTACQNVGIEDCRPHDLRRSLGSWMLMRGEPIAVVSETLGHESIRVTEQVYAHILPEKVSAATDSTVAAMFKGKI